MSDAPTFAGHPLAALGVTHYLARTLEGGPGFTWSLPLCWDAEARARFPGESTETHDEAWWVAVDHETLDPDPFELEATTDRAAVTCRDCLEWLHA